MRINRHTWITFGLISILSLVVWHRYSYSQLAFIDFSVDRTRALSIARSYLAQRGYDYTVYETAAIFKRDSQANRYLQKTLGFEKYLAFIKEHDFDVFYWLVRFYKEKEKEGFLVAISSSTGEVISFRHKIDASTAKEELEREEAKQIAINFLKDSFNFDPDRHTLQGDLKTIHDYRVDYKFAWQKKDVQISWSEEENSGIGKILSHVVVSGNEILSFTKHSFAIPPQFIEDLSKRRLVGLILSTIVKIFYIALFTTSIFFVIVRRNHLAMHTTKKFYIVLMFISFLLSLLSNINQFELILFDYNTTSPFGAFIITYGVNAIISALFITVAILMPSLSGELLHFEVFKDRKEGTFLHYILSTFFSRSVAKAIFLGYFVSIIMLGIQSVLLKVGQDHFGVWVEYSWMTQLTTAYLPFLAAFTIGFKASFSEEIMYRMFAIPLGKKIFKNTFVAVILASLIWGFAHSGYPVFPMWFRGIEVTCLGLFLSFVYLRFGIIPVIVGHYLFDVFWNTTGYLLGQTQSSYFYSSLSILLLPLMFGIIAFILNRKGQEQQMRWHLNKHQVYNLDILKSYLNLHRNKYKVMTLEEIRKEISSHGWDVAVVDVALEDWGGEIPQADKS